MEGKLLNRRTPAAALDAAVAASLGAGPRGRGCRCHCFLKNYPHTFLSTSRPEPKISIGGVKGSFMRYKKEDSPQSRGPRPGGSRVENFISRGGHTDQLFLDWKIWLRPVSLVQLLGDTKII